MTPARAIRFAAIYPALMAAHDVGDHVLQTDRQAMHKAGPDLVGATAMAGHIVSYHLAQLAALRAVNRSLGLELRWSRVLAAVALSAATHAFLDRRWPVKWILEKTGSRGFATGTFEVPGFIWSSGPLQGRLPVPLHGPYLADQALHHACLFVAAFVASR